MRIRVNRMQERQIVEYLTQLLRDFDTAAGELVASLGPLDPEPHLELDAVSTTYTSGGIRTVVVKVYRRIGGARPSTWYRAFPCDVATQASLTFATLFRPDTRPLDVIAPIVAGQMSAEAGQPLTIHPAVAGDPDNYQDFALTDDAVVFFFGSGRMHPASEATEVRVPLAVVADLLSPRG